MTVAIHAPASDTAAVNSFADRVAAVAGDSAGVTAQRVVNQIRATPSGFETKVTGNAAAFIDQPNAIGSHLPQAIGLLVVLTFNTPEAGDALHNLRATYGREWQEEPVPE